MPRRSAIICLEHRIGVNGGLHVGERGARGEEGGAEGVAHLFSPTAVVQQSTDSLMLRAYTQKEEAFPKLEKKAVSCSSYFLLRE